MYLFLDLYGTGRSSEGQSGEMGNLLRLLSRDDAKRDDLYHVFVDFESKLSLFYVSVCQLTLAVKLTK